MSFLRHLCLDEHIRIIELTIHTCQTSIANESIGEYGKFPASDGLNTGLLVAEFINEDRYLFNNLSISLINSTSLRGCIASGWQMLPDLSINI